MLTAYPAGEVAVANEKADPGAEWRVDISEQKCNPAFGPLVRLWRQIADEVVGEVPDDSAVCEFDCRKVQCSKVEWAVCARRLHAAAGERWPTADIQSAADSSRRR